MPVKSSGGDWAGPRRRRENLAEDMFFFLTGNFPNPMTVTAH
jgi:hypothetical protein